MKKVVSVALVAIVCLAVFAVYSCKKHKYYRFNKGFKNDVEYPVAYVVNGESSTLTVINTSTNSVEETMELKGSSFPHHIYLNHHKTLMAIAFAGSDLSGGHTGHEMKMDSKMVVQVFDTKTGKHKANIFLKSAPHNAVFSPDSEELWIGQSGDNSKISIYDTKKWKLKSEIEINQGMLSEITFSVDGTKAYSANTGSNSITVINVADKSIVTKIDVGKAPVGAWAASNGKMYVDNEESKTVTEIDVLTNAILSTINLGFKPGYVAYNDVTKELWVSDAENGKLVYFTQISNVWTFKGEITTGADAHAIAFNSDNSIGYVTNQGAKNISVINANTHEVISTIEVGDKPNGIALID